MSIWDEWKTSNDIGNLNVELNNANVAVSSCQSALSSLQSQLSTKRAQHAAAVNFKNGPLADLSKADGTLKTDLDTLGNAVAQGVGEPSLHKNVKDIRKGNAGQIKDATTACNDLINRLNGEIASLNSQIKTANGNLQAAKNSVTSIQNSLTADERHLAKLREQDE